MKVAVIGCGSVAQVHLEALAENPDTEIIAVADIKPERADAAASKYGATAYYGFEELLKNEKPDSVHICTPHYLHTPMAVAALNKGINVLLEKPCSVSFEEIDALRKAQTKSGKQLAICFQNRYNACVQQAKKIILSGELGKIKAARAFVTWFRDKAYYSDDWHGTIEKECGGVLINQSIHTMDLLQYLCGDCKKVTAHVSNDGFKGIIEVEDTASVHLELEGGIKAVFYATLSFSQNSDVFLEITLENGRLRIEGEKLFVADKDGKTTEFADNSNAVYHGRSYWGTGHSALINDYYYCLKSGEKFEIDAYEGGKTAEIVLACYESSASGESIKTERK